MVNNPNQTLIHHFLETSAELYPDKTALIHEDTRATYSQINTMANSLAYWLIDQGIKTGDRVTFVIENSLDYVVTYYGILKSGAVAAPLSTDLKPDTLNPLLAELEPAAIISSSRFERLLKASDQSLIQNLKTLCPIRSVLTSDLRLLASGMTSAPCALPSALDPDGLASIIYTSGSTGKPKGVMLSHQNIVSNTHSICQYLSLSDEDIQMVVLPFFYVMGKSLLNTHFAVGGTVVINNKFAYPASVINQMIEENVTGFSGVPSTYAYLLHRSPLEKNRDKLTSLRYCSQAGGHMSRKIKQDLRQVLPDHTKIYIMYGATEASARLTYLEPDFYEDKMGSIGKPIPGVSLKVLDTKGKPINPGKTGEIVSAGPNIMQGYWKDDPTTKAVLDENGYHTGDFGYQDNEGFFYITGRKDNLLKVSGHRVNIQEIEDVFMETGLLIEAAILAVPDTLLGNRLIAMLVPKDGFHDDQKIMGICTEKLPKFKLPSDIKFVRSLPKTSIGKIDRHKCLELLK